MECKWTFLLATYLTTSSMGIYIDHTKTDFNSAKDRCTLATPKIRYSQTGPTVDVESIKGLEIDENAWVGYTKDYEVFRYLGCVNSTLLSNQQNTTVQTDIGECKSVCNSYTHFGVMALEDGGAMCKCFNVKNLTRYLDYLIPCKSNDRNNELAFGGHSKLSVYTSVPSAVYNALRNSPDWNESDYNCAWLYQPPNSYRWTDCSESVRPLCFSNWWQNETLKEYGDKFKTWNLATEFCLKKRNYPYLLSYHQVQWEIENTQFWTSNVRAYTISETKDKAIGDGSDPYVAVYVAVPLVLIVVCMMVVVVFCWWKRKRPMHPTSDIHNSKRNLAYFQDDNADTEPRPNSSEVYNEICDINESTHEDYDTIKDRWEYEPTRNSVNNHSYFVLEKTQTGNFQVEKSDDYDYAKEAETRAQRSQKHTYHILEKTQNPKTTQSEIDKKVGYDYAKVMPKRTSEESKHQTRERVNKAFEDTDYDHLDDGREANKITKAQNHITGIDDHHVYNKAGVNATTDTYDHVNKEVPDIKRLQDVSGNRNKDHATTYNRLKDAADDDMYNHVNQGKGSAIDEEPYNVTNPDAAKPADTDNHYDHTT